VAARVGTLILYLGSSWLHSIRTPLFDSREFALTNSSNFWTQPPSLQPGQPSQRVDVPLSNDGVPSNGLNPIPTPPPRPPGLNRPHLVHSVHRPLPGGEPLQRQTHRPEAISRWHLICIAVELLLIIFLLFNDPLERIIDIGPAKQRASFENASLAFEKEKTERERKVMVRERELWEKAREARVPQDAFWEVVWPAWDCSAYGKREYWGLLQNIPEDWDAIEACMSMPVEIKGVNIRHPDRCIKFIFPTVQVRGYWVVDWDQPDCKPWYRDFEDKVGHPFFFPPCACLYVPPVRDARATTPERVGSEQRLWGSMTRKDKIGGCYVTAHLWSGTWSIIRVLCVARKE
jgi:hypothetical protein